MDSDDDGDHGEAEIDKNCKEIGDLADDNNDNRDGDSGDDDNEDRVKMDGTDKYDDCENKTKIEENDNHGKEIDTNTQIFNKKPISSAQARQNTQ